MNHKITLKSLEDAKMAVELLEANGIQCKMEDETTDIRISEHFDYINLEKTMENVSIWKYEDSYSYVDVDGCTIESVICENDDPQYVYRGNDDEFMGYLEKYIDERGVYVSLGDGVDDIIRNAFRDVRMVIPKTAEERDECLENDPDIAERENVLFFNTAEDGEFDGVTGEDYMTGFGALIRGNREDGYDVTYGVQCHCGPCWNPPLFSSYDDEGNKRSSWDISCPLCRKVIELSREMISTDRE